MDEIPPFWRTEVYHPLVVHLPVVVLILGPLFYLSGLDRRISYLHPAGRVLLWIGTVGAWAAYYTGHLADGIVSRQICDPTVLKDHEILATYATWIFTGAVLVDLTIFWNKLKSYRKFIRIASGLMMIAGSVFIILSGHEGSRLVHQQGAGVYHPSEDCHEFE
jgi:uncharacterized membrane protein